MSGKRNIPQKSAKRTLVLLISLILSCIIVYGLYRFLIATVNPEVVLISYMAVATVIIFWYVIYNRGFSRKGITAEMLPESWDEEKKTAFIEDGKYRLVKSKPLLILVIAFIFTFALEALELIALPFFSSKTETAKSLSMAKNIVLQRILPFSSPTMSFPTGVS